jgi:formylglycine-generating enzyme required for sulfatase activity
MEVKSPPSQNFAHNQPESPPLTVDNSVTPLTKQGEERDYEIIGGLKMRFCWIPPGKATLGSPSSEKSRTEIETEHPFELKRGIWMAKYPVRQVEYETVMGKNPSIFSKTGRGKSAVQDQDTSLYPVENVSWTDAQLFIKTCKIKLRLPHEDEWEYACRGDKGNKLPFYWGMALNGDRANCDGSFPYGEGEGVNFKRTTKTGLYIKIAPHPWGLCDMNGNVWQWCDNSITTARALRGGSWEEPASKCRSASRFWEIPVVRHQSFGFRVCLDPKE